MKKIVWRATALSFAIVVVCPFDAVANDRTLEEFKEYVRGKVAGQMDEDQIDQFAKMVDKDGSGTISDSEFENRMEAYQRVLSGETSKEDNSEAQPEPKPSNRRTGRRQRMSQRMQARLVEAGISPGKSLPDVSGLDIDGKPFKLADLKGHYSVIVNGCLT